MTETRSGHGFVPAAVYPDADLLPGGWLLPTILKRVEVERPAMYIWKSVFPRIAADATPARDLESVSGKECS
jgi:hypothetical protein